MKMKTEGNIEFKSIIIYFLVTVIFILIFLIPGFYSPILMKSIGTTVFLLIIATSIRLSTSIIFGIMKTETHSKQKRYPFVSIIVPSYNEDEVLDRTIRSIQELDYPKDKIEMIYVYESKCIDRTEEIILGFAKNDQRIRPIKRTSNRGGKGAATNFGIKYAKGEIIVSVDADHSLNPDVLKKIFVLFQIPDTVCVKGRCRAINKNKNFLTKLVGVERDIFERLGIYASYKMNGFSIFGGGQAFFRKNIFDMIGKFDEDIMTEDIDLSVRLHLAGYNIIVDPQIESWEENPSNLTSWWHQRRRWSRGWMQVARKHMSNIIKSQKLTMVKKIDMMICLSFSLLPPITIIMIALIIITFLGFKTLFFPNFIFIPLWVFVTMTPFVVGFTTWCLDVRDGEKPRWDEIPFIIITLIYIIFHSLISWTAFIDEFILRKNSEYIKTSRNS